MKDRSPAAVLGSPAALGTAAGVGSPAGEVVLGRHLAVGHTANFPVEVVYRGGSASDPAYDCLG